MKTPKEKYNDAKAVVLDYLHGFYSFQEFANHKLVNAVPFCTVLDLLSITRREAE